MRQTRVMSLVEAVANVTVGYGIAVLTQMLVFPLFGTGRPSGRSPPAGPPAEKRAPLSQSVSRKPAMLDSRSSLAMTSVAPVSLVSCATQMK